MSKRELSREEFENRLIFFISSGGEYSDASEYIKWLDTKRGKGYIPTNELKEKLKRKSNQQKLQIIAEDITPPYHFSEVPRGTIENALSGFMTSAGITKVLKRLYAKGILIKCAHKPADCKKVKWWNWGIKDTFDNFKKISKMMYNSNVFLPFTYTYYFRDSFTKYFPIMFKGISDSREDPHTKKNSNVEAQAQQFLFIVAKSSSHLIYLVIQEGLTFTKQILEKLLAAFSFEEIVAKEYKEDLKTKKEVKS